jgi:hypothetical protein
MTGKTLQIDLDEDEPTAGAAGEAIIDEDNPAPGARREADVIDEDVSPDDKLPSQAIQNADRSVTMPLAYPVTLRFADLPSAQRRRPARRFRRQCRGERTDCLRAIDTDQPGRDECPVRQDGHGRHHGLRPGAQPFFDEWPKDWPVILGCIAANTGFSAAEIESFDHRQAVFWWNAIMEWRKREHEASK